MMEASRRHPSAVLRLIDDQVDNPEPSAAQREPLADGFTVQMTHRHRVTLDPQQGPLLDAGVDSTSTVAVRELGFRLLDVLDGAGSLGSASPLSGSGLGRVFHRLRAGLAGRLIFPFDDFEPTHRPDVSSLWAQDVQYLTVSRRLLTVPADFTADLALPPQSGPLVCYVVAATGDDAVVESLLARAVPDLMRKRWGRPPVSDTFYDHASNLFVWSPPGREVHNRYFLKLFALPPAVVTEDELPAPDVAVVRELSAAASASPPGAVDTDASPSDRFARSRSSGQVAEALSEDVLARSRSDIRFIESEIRRAQEAGRPLDESFVLQVAQQRLSFARKHHQYPAGRSTGPRLDTSRRLVQSVVRAHLID